MNVEPASIGDLPRIQEAYAEGRRRQQERGTLVWPEFSDASLIAEVREQKLFRVMDNDAMVGTFAIAYEDQAVWGDRERGAQLTGNVRNSPSVKDASVASPASTEKLTFDAAAKSTDRAFR